jgi:hypothetical protein
MLWRRRVICGGGLGIVDPIILPPPPYPNTENLILWVRILYFQRGLLCPFSYWACRMISPSIRWMTSSAMLEA